MKNYITLIIAPLLGLYLVGCNSVEKKNIGLATDYDKYLSNSDGISIDRAKRELDFWITKYNKTPDQYTYLGQLANAHETLFTLNGNIKHLKKAEECYTKSMTISNRTDTGILHGLCRNYISQHRFKECLPLLKKAKEIGYKKQITNQILFDVHLELGNFELASDYLTQIKKPNSFDYLIRKAKWEDHKGNLDEAIKYLNVALKIAEKNDNKTLKIWSYSNLGDFYGHQGSIKKAYDSYLKTLQLDPENTYVLKGIAWIQYAYNYNTVEANRILDSIIKRKKAPELYLFKSELAEYEKDSIYKVIYKNKFLELANKPEYGAMYNTYKAAIWASEKSTTTNAIITAKQEILNRPTPLSYDLLAWSYYKAGKYKEALALSETLVDGHTFEPEALLHTAKIYKVNNLYSGKIASIKKELLEASFELGPITTAEVINL